MENDALQQKADIIARLLYEHYPEVKPFLDHSNAHELLFATILSAQNTDAGVNKATPALFKRYKTLEDYANADLEELDSYIKTINFHRNKAKNIKGAAQKIMNEFGGILPDDIDKLQTLPGVARKTASVVLYQWFGKNEGFTVDTHVLRLAKWFGLTKHKDPVKVERDLMALFAQDTWGDISLRIIRLGREILTAKNPKHKGTIWEDLVDIQ